MAAQIALSAILGRNAMRLCSSRLCSSSTTRTTGSVEPAMRLLRALQVERSGWRAPGVAAVEEGRDRRRDDAQPQRVYVALERQQICEEFGVALRDLRTVDPGFRNQMPLILVRPNALLVSMNDVRAIISDSRMLIFDYERASVKRYIRNLDHFLSPPRPENEDDESTMKAAHQQDGRGGTGPIDDLVDVDGATRVGSSIGGGEREKRRTGGTPHAPFEIRALDASVDHVCSGIERKYAQLNVHVNRALNSALVTNVQLLAGDDDADIPINVDNPAIMRDLQSLLPVKHKLRGLSMDCKEASEAIQELLDNDEDLDALFLVDGYAAGGDRLPGEHQEAEVMLENHLKRIEQVRNDVLGMRDEISASEEHIRMALDRHRNSLLKMTLMLNIFAVSVSSAAIIPALFGMNLVSQLESNAYAFGATIGVSAGVMLGVAMTMMIVARRYKITLV